MNEGAQFFADQLERLLNLPLQPKEALKLWNEEAKALQQTMRQHPEIETPHEVWHFYSDADIRSKPHEEEYRQVQEQYVREFIGKLRAQGHAS